MNRSNYHQPYVNTPPRIPDYPIEEQLRAQFANRGLGAVSVNAARAAQMQRFSAHAAQWCVAEPPDCAEPLPAESPGHPDPFDAESASIKLRSAPGQADYGVASAGFTENPAV